MTERSPSLSEVAQTAAAARRPASRPQTSLLSLTIADVVTLVMLAGIVVAGGYLRLAHNNWDANADGQSLHLHPDERFITTVVLDTKAPDRIADYFDTDSSRLNPYNSDHPTFVYGELPLFLGKFVASHWNLLTLGIGGDWYDYDHVNRAGRALTGIFDTATILMVFLIAARLRNARAGLVASFLYAFSALPIQHSHFFIVDPYATFFAAVAIYGAVRLAQEGGWPNAVAAGLAVGLGTASKVTVVALVPVVMLGAGIRLWPAIEPILLRRRNSGQAANGRAPVIDAAARVLGLWVVATAAAFVAFRVAMPYAFEAPSWGNLLPWTIELNSHWVDDELNQRQLLDGSSFPPNVQWIGRTPWLWPLQQMVLWGMGPALGVTAWIAVVYAAARAWFRRELVWLVPLSWILGYFAVMGGQFSLYMRYFLPLYPALAALAGVALIDFWDWSRAPSIPGGKTGWLERLAGAAGGRLLPAAGVATTALVAGLTAAWGLSFFDIYSEPVTRVQASEWIHENLPDGSLLSFEHWDDPLPFGGPRQFEHVGFGNYEFDSPEKVDLLLDNLDAVGYVVLSSNRLSGSIPRAPAIWPVTSRYYEALYAGELGFRKIAEFTSPPEIFGVEIQDRAAEESWTVYDHPPVTIYEKTPSYSRERAKAVLNVECAVTAINVEPKDAGKNAIQLRPDEAATQQRGGTWTDVFSATNFANDHPLLTWLIVLELTAFALVPLASVLFRELPDRGYLLTKPLGFVVFAYLVWAPVSFGLVHFTRTTSYVALIALLLFGVATRQLWARQVRELFRDHWRAIVLAEAIFLAAFIAFYAFRLANPDVWHPFRGGEKPMEMAYLTAVTRSTTIPPYDPWYAGGYINYYYYGFFMTGNVMKLTGMLPEIAFNLAVPTFFALTAALVWSITYNLVEMARRAIKRQPGLGRIPAWTTYWAAGAAVFLVMLAGNVRGMDQGIDRLAEASPYQIDVPVLGTIAELPGGVWRLIRGEDIEYDYWDPSRAIRLTPDQIDQTAPITEFPMFTFLYADLHAHMMVMPVSLLSVAIGLVAVASARRWRSLPRGQRLALEWSVVALLGLLVGSARWTNAWDFPTFGLMASGTLFIAGWRGDGRITLSTLGMWLAKSAAVLALAVALFLPASQRFVSPSSGFLRAEQTTQLDDYFWHFGLFIAVAAALLGGWLFRAMGRARSLRLLRNGNAVTLPLAGVVFALPALAVIVGTQQDRMGVAAFASVMVAVAAILAYREMTQPRPDSHVRVFVLALLAMAFGLGAGVEIVTLKDDITRMNTVFKFYLHAWLLAGIASAVGLWYLLAVMRPDLAMRRAGARAVSRLTVVRWAPYGALATVMAVLLLGAALYPILSLPMRLEERFAELPRSINGMTFMRVATFGDDYGDVELAQDYEGILWMREHVEGSPVIIEAVTPLYRWGARYSIYTGLPSVSGWDWHQRQQRGRFAYKVSERQADVARFYSVNDVAAQTAILDAYGVQYVIVGQLERNYFGEEGIRNIEGGLGGRLDKLFDNGGTQIYRVRPRPIPPAPQVLAP